EESISRMAGSYHGVRLEPEQLIAAAHKAGRPAAGWLAAPLALANPVLVFELGVAYVDLASAFFLTAGVVFMARALRSQPANPGASSGTDAFDNSVGGMGGDSDPKSTKNFLKKLKGSGDFGFKVPILTSPSAIILPCGVLNSQGPFNSEVQRGDFWR
ncbi:hypothetical protein B4Q13_15520, partial [Lacticaseibacillus rhamnosus]